jgi:hypothetical protein
MMVQMSAANDILSNPNSSESEIARANSVVANSEAYFKDLKFETSTSKDKNGKVVTEYRGVKTLANLQFEETKRNNKINEKLQRQANEIAKSSAGAAWAGVKQQELNLKETIRANDQDFGKEIRRRGKPNSDGSYTYGGYRYTIDDQNIPTVIK